MPTTANENSQLLSLLNSSFQRRLDDAHPPIRPADSLQKRSMPISGPRVENVSARATMDHLQSLLQHPLLAEVAREGKESSSEAAKAALTMDHAMRRGKVSLELVEKCMQTYVKTLKGGNAIVENGHRLGSKISAWFTSCDPIVREDFLCSTQALRNAVPIMYADGLDEIVWEWLEMLYARDFATGSPEKQVNSRTDIDSMRWILHECHLTFLMIKEALRRSKLDAAVLQFTQACEYMQSTGRMSETTRSLQPWQSTVKAITMAILRRRGQHTLSADLFDRLMNHRSSWSASNTLQFALLSIYHPTQPSGQELINSMAQPDQHFEIHLDHIKNMSDQGQKIVVNALLDGAQLLLEQGSSSLRLARRVVDLVEKHFPSLANPEGDRATERRIQSVRQHITSHQPIPASLAPT
jgi:hypothetical protein